MADFCKQCAENHGFDTNDFLNLVKEGYMVDALCEGCGHIWVDHEGACISSNCLRDHESNEWKKYIVYLSNGETVIENHYDMDFIALDKLGVKYRPYLTQEEE